MDPKPLLMINAAKDDDVPAEFAAEFDNSIKNKCATKNIPVEYFIAD